MIVATSALSDQAKARLVSAQGGPLMISDWLRTLMIHYEVDPGAFAPLVPFDLDLYEDKAYVSLVAFTMRRLRLAKPGLSRISIPGALNHSFLNVRTYVTHRGEPGIYFLAEWLPSRLSVMLGPPLYGLPYRFGHLDYRHDHENGDLRGSVFDGDRRRALHYQAPIDAHADYTACNIGGRDHFLMERYTAYTQYGRWRRRFRIWHRPWPQVPVSAVVHDCGLLGSTGDWCAKAKIIGANYSPGVKDVWMGAPQWV